MSLQEYEGVQARADWVVTGTRGFCSLGIQLAIEPEERLRFDSRHDALSPFGIDVQSSLVGSRPLIRAMIREGREPDSADHAGASCCSHMLHVRQFV